jgi:hypothetical protein
MSTNPLAPRLIRGAIIGLDPFNPLASAVVFQYNPDTMTRTLVPQTSGGGSERDRSEALRFTGPPKETISFAIELDAADQPGPSALVVAGVHPPLAALEMLLYPKSAAVIANIALAQLGVIEVIPPEAPLTLLAWGPARIVPIRLKSMTITEEQYDTLLNPTRAKVDLSLEVLSYRDLKLTHPGHSIFIAHQIAKEVFATAAIAGSAFNLGASF